MSDSPTRTALSTPVPTAPEAGSVVPQDAVTFGWVAPPGARTFDLRVARASAPDETLVELADLPTTETTLASALPAGDLLWWVRASGGTWSAPTAFRAGTPADLEVALQTEAATALETRRAEHAGGLAPVTDARPADPAWPYAEGEALEGAPPPAWSQVPGFGAPTRAALERADVEPPRPLSPLGGEVVDAVAVSLAWTPVPGATRYEVELSPHAGFGREVMALDAGLATEIGLPGLVPALGWKLLWRVRAHVGDRATPWSAYGRFYPAGVAAAQAFRAALDEARAAQRRQRDHDRRVRELELDLLDTHEREDAVTDAATYLAVLGITASGLTILAVAVAYAFWRSMMM